MAEALYRKYRPQIFEDVVGQEHIERTIKNAIEQDKVSHAYLFTGPAGSNKTMAAYAFAQAVLCPKGASGPRGGNCGACDACRRIMRKKHPDVRYFAPEGAGGYLVEQIRDIVADTSMAPIQAHKKVYILDRVDLLGVQAANAFLKTLEEPPSDVVLILLARTRESVLPTILSRCQVVPFRTIPASEAAGIIVQNTGASREQARMAVVRAREAGFANLSLDLMFGLPNQTLTGWRATLENVLRLKPEHMSCYALKVEPNTPLWEYRDCANLPNDDVQADMYLAASEILQDHGYEHYEISNFAKPGFRSRHNLKYWTGGEYLGFGPCAASDFAGKRFTIEPDLRAYVEGIAHHGSVLSECETIPPRERAGEYVMLRSRIVSGLDAQEYERSYLLPFAPLQQLLERFAGHGLAAQSGSRWYLTPRGWLVSNRIILALQDAQEKSTPLAKKR